MNVRRDSGVSRALVLSLLGHEKGQNESQSDDRLLTDLWENIFKDDGMHEGETIRDDCEYW